MRLQASEQAPTFARFWSAGAFATNPTGPLLTDRIRMAAIRGLNDGLKISARGPARRPVEPGIAEEAAIRVSAHGV